ncbi:hypothetical protein Tco_1003826 [Tanacetum coccineum]|uniref:Uncharacterized protein n=1 Tax=Tanacetum coccineum TaxID=301880 RepID=A0ABQ5FBI6_9ASTR
MNMNMSVILKTLRGIRIYNMHLLLSPRLSRTSSNPNNNLRTSSNTWYRTTENPSKNDMKTRHNRHRGQNENQRAVVIACNRETGQLSAEEHDWLVESNENWKHITSTWQRFQDVVPEVAQDSGPTYDTVPLEKVKCGVRTSRNVGRNLRTLNKSGKLLPLQQPNP